MALSLLINTPNGPASYHVIVEQGFHNGDKPPWNHCVLNSYADGNSWFGVPPLQSVRYELRGPNALPVTIDPLKQSVIDLFYAHVLKQPEWAAATIIPNLPPAPAILDQPQVIA